LFNWYIEMALVLLLTLTAHDIWYLRATEYRRITTYEQKFHVNIRLFISATVHKYILFYFLIFIVGGGVQLGRLGTAVTNRPIVPTSGDYDYGEIGGMMIDKGKRSTRRKTAPVPHYPPQTPHAARTRTRAAAVGSQRLTAWATALPKHTRSFSSVPSKPTSLLPNLRENMYFSQSATSADSKTHPSRPQFNSPVQLVMWLNMTVLHFVDDGSNRIRNGFNRSLNERVKYMEVNSFRIWRRE
jgi:hypothetical protein